MTSGNPVENRSCSRVQFGCPTPKQMEVSNRETALPVSEETRLQSGRLELKLTPNALVLVKVSAQ